MSASRNKHRGAQDERDIAALLGGQRHPANTGGPEDVAHDRYAIQVKGGLSVVTAVMRSALGDARKAAAGTGRLPLVALIDRKGTRLQRWVAFPMEEWTARESRPCICPDCGNEHGA